jgi:hypothetical protein
MHEGEDEEERIKGEVTSSFQEEIMKGTHKETGVAIRQHISSVKLRCGFR